MRRPILAYLVAATVATGSAEAQLGTLWLQGTDGSDTVTVGVSETAIIQVWLEIDPSVTLIGIDANLTAFDSSWGKDLAVEVQGFIDHVNPGLMQRHSRGPVEDDLPHGLIDEYWYAAYDFNLPLVPSSGTAGPATVLLDEIIIHGLDDGELPSTNLVYLNLGSTEPNVYWLEFEPIPPPGQWNLAHGLGLLSVSTGGESPFSVDVVPEPSFLALISAAALLIRTRQRRQ